MITTTNPTCRFSERVNHIPKSFLREILKITKEPDIISFAGGLPNPKSFPVEALKQAAIKVLDSDGINALQYAPSEGYLPLRKYIAERYMKNGMAITPEEILITNGSQQGLDLIGKVFIDNGDKIILERPSYLGAIQAFSAYQPSFDTVALLPDGIDTNELSNLVEKYNPKLFYAIPNFQNPTGISYSDEKRKRLAEIIQSSNTLLIEDDPYGDIKFTNKIYSPIRKMIGHNGILLGSFSKIISPGMRMGWIVATPEIIEKFLVAKQAADLHSNFLSQRIILQFLTDNELDSHIDSIKKLYQYQKNHMIKMMEKYFPKEVNYTNPEGGMFIWVTLPYPLSAQQLLERAVKEKVVFVPGNVFYLDNSIDNTLRINYSNSGSNEIENGISILAGIINDMLKRSF